MCQNYDKNFGMSLFLLHFFGFMCALWVIPLEVVCQYDARGSCHDVQIFLNITKRLFAITMGSLVGKGSLWGNFILTLENHF